MSEIPELERVGPYVIERTLGRGGMGAVYLARHESLDRTVALKVLHANVADEMSLKRFRLEAECAMKITHPNLVKVWDYGQDGTTTYLAMECVSGETLADVLQEGGALPIPRALTLAREMLSALSALHREGITHRDLKPQNVMIDAAGITRVLDMGLVKVVDRTVLTREGMMVGTPRYLPPEVVIGLDSDHRADLYQVGLILYETIAGRPAVSNAPIPTLLNAIVNDPVEPLDLKGPDADRVRGFLAKTLAKERAERFATADDALAFLAGTPRAGRKTSKGLLRPSFPPASATSGSSAPSFVEARKVAPWLALGLVVAGLAAFALLRPAAPPEPVASIRPSASPVSAAATPAPPVSRRQLVLDLTRALERAVSPSLFEALAGSIPPGPKREAEHEVWRGRCSGILLQDDLPRLAARFHADPDALLEPDVTSAERAAFVRARGAFADLEAALRTLVGDGCGLPIDDLAGPELVPVPVKPAGARPWVAIEFVPAGSPPSAYARAFPHVRMGNLPATFGRSNSNILRKYEEKQRKIYKDKTFPAPPVPPREAWLEFKIVGGASAECLQVRLSPPAARGLDVAELRASDTGAAREGFLRIDPRLLTGPVFAFGMAYLDRETHVSTAGITVEHLGLYIVDATYPAATPAAPPAAR